MRNNKEETKDPFAEYDKFWDELDKVEEIKDDEDYFKERSLYKNQNYKTINKNRLESESKKTPKSSILFFVFGFIVLFAFVGGIRLDNVIFLFAPIIMFGIIGFVILSVLSKLKNL
jgi:hypothetical protein